MKILNPDDSEIVYEREDNQKIMRLVVKYKADLPRKRSVIT